MSGRLTVTAGAASLAVSISLYPLVASGAWFWAGIGAIGVAAAAGAATRLRALPAAACLLAALAAEAIYVNVVFAAGESWARLVPTPASVHHLQQLVAAAGKVLRVDAPPVPGTAGVLMITVAGIGLVAVVTDLLAVRLRRPALAGLPLLVMFCVPLATAASPGLMGETVVFSLGAAGYLALLSTDGRERLRLWGRIVRAWQGVTTDGDSTGPDTRQLSAAGRRVGLAAVVLALLIPLLLPGLTRHQLLHGGPGGPGGVQANLPSPMDQLTAQLHESRPKTVLTYHFHTTDRTFYAEPPYLQVYVLQRLSTADWTLTAPSVKSPLLGRGTLPPVPGHSAGTSAATVTETVRLGAVLPSSSHTLGYLPVPYAPRQVNVPGSWQVDPGTLTVFSAGTPLRGLGYTVTSMDVQPTQAQLRIAPAPPTSIGGYLSVPQPLLALTRLADLITGGQTTLIGKAVALQDWFTEPGRFTYTLNPPSYSGPRGLVKFLTKSRRGYCQQFAFGMAVLARLIGIPSRVAVGYTQGTPLGNGEWQVTTADAHAWPELYFQGAGWLRFEPTPAATLGRPGQATAISPSYAQSTGPGQSPQPAPTPTAPAQQGTSPGGKASRRGGSRRFQHLGGPGGTGRHRVAGAVPASEVILAALALIVAAPRLARGGRRRLRWWRAGTDAERAHAAWRELCDELADYRLGGQASETPRALARRVSETLGLTGADGAALSRIATAQERACYAPAPAPAGRLREDGAAVSRALARSAGLRARARAQLLPASVIAPTLAALRRTPDMFGWLDAAWARPRGAARGRPRQAQPRRG